MLLQYQDAFLYITISSWQYSAVSITIGSRSLGKFSSSHIIAMCGAHQELISQSQLYDSPRSQVAKGRYGSCWTSHGTEELLLTLAASYVTVLDPGYPWQDIGSQLCDSLDPGWPGQDIGSQVCDCPRSWVARQDIGSQYVTVQILGGQVGHWQLLCDLSE